MISNPTKRHLSPARKQLIEQMQRINYGRIEKMLVRRGEPVLEPMPCVVHEFKFPGDNGPRPEISAADFTLKAQVIALFAQLDSLGNGLIRSIEIQRGLPFRMTVEEVCA